jgi:hypothetical protein
LPRFVLHLEDGRGPKNVTVNGSEWQISTRVQIDPDCLEVGRDGAQKQRVEPLSEPAAAQLALAGAGVVVG